MSGSPNIMMCFALTQTALLVLLRYHFPPCSNAYKWTYRYSYSSPIHNWWRDQHEMVPAKGRHFQWACQRSSLSCNPVLPKLNTCLNIRKQMACIRKVQSAISGERLCLICSLFIYCKPAKYDLSLLYFHNNAHVTWILPWFILYNMRQSCVNQSVCGQKVKVTTVTI